MQSQIIATPKLFIGVDVHEKTWIVHLRIDISDHKGFSMPPNPDILINYTLKHFSNHEVGITYEAGCCGFSELEQGFFTTDAAASLGAYYRFANNATNSAMGITPRCKPLLRSYVIEAAWVAIRTDPSIQTYYLKHATRNSKFVIV